MRNLHANLSRQNILSKFYPRYPYACVSWAHLEQESRDLTLDIIEPAKILKPFIMEGQSR